MRHRFFTDSDAVKAEILGCTKEGDAVDWGSVRVHPLPESCGNPDVDFVAGVGLFDEPRITWSMTAANGSRVICANRID